jgi:hypothetical protein
VWRRERFLRFEVLSLTALFKIKKGIIMPVSITYALVLLVLSAITCTIGTYLDMEFFNQEDIPYLYVLDFIWFCIVCWVAWIVTSQRRDIRLVIIAVAIVTITSNIWEYSEYGVTNGLYAYILESVIYIIIFVLLNTSSAKGWYKPKESYRE